MGVRAPRPRRWHSGPVPKRSAGLLLYRHAGDAIEVLLVHPGGPFWANRDEGAWSVPKGEVDGADDRATAAREFAEELGHPPPAAGWLDLGEVQVMAQVKLNGQDLGILWKPPFRVNVSGALHSGLNTLEIRVADLWPNRMIGDAALPASERFTWSSYEPFSKNSPLPKSGLLGPVRLTPTEKIILEGD